MGQLTITTTAAQDARLVAAYGRRLGLTDAAGAPRAATAAEVKKAIVDGIRDVVHTYEQQRKLETPLDAFDPT
jgi:hypothetical protein